MEELEKYSVEKPQKQVTKPKKLQDSCLNE